MRFIVGIVLLSSSLVLKSQNANPSFMVYEQGQADVRFFANTYLEKPLKGSDYLFNTLFADVMAGTSGRVNVGLRIRYRTVLRDDDLGPGDAWTFQNRELDSVGNYKRHGLSGAELLIRHKIFGKLRGLSMQHSLGFPAGNQLQQHLNRGFLDWDGLTWHSQLFLNYLRGRFQIFSDLGVRAENLQARMFDKNRSSYFSIGYPCSVLPGFLMGRQHYLYALMQILPGHSFQRYASNGPLTTNFNFQHQWGIGYKFFFLKKWELELIGSLFNPDGDRPAYTMNLGVRRFWGRLLY